VIGKSELYHEIARSNRGILATETEQSAILAIIAQLEDRNPTPKPTEAGNLLEGDWLLLYTTSSGILQIDQLPLLKLGQVYQCIRMQGQRLYNIAEVYGLPALEGIVSVAAHFQPVSEHRVEVKFERAILGLQRLMGYRTPQSYIQQLELGQKLIALDFSIAERRDPLGWLDITYLDEDMRIGRGNEGSVFVLSKVPS
jgi:hypothetical protein